MNIKINSEDDYSAEFQENDTVKSVVQNIALLLNTKQGTVPMYRDFGLPMEFIDKPMDAAETLAVLEITEAIEKFEPRAKLVDIWLEKSKDGKMTVTVEVSVNE